MKLLPTLLSLCALAATQTPAFAADSTTPNLLTSATAETASSAFSGSFVPSNLVDGNAATEFVFGSQSSQFLSISGFSAPAGIDSITFFDTNNFSNRASPSVSIYVSSSDTGGSLAENDYGLHGTYALPTDPGSTTYTDGTDASSSKGFDTLSGLGIAAGTRSLLFDFAPTTQPASSNYQTGLSEIEAFAPAGGVPEPSTWALLSLGGMGLLGLALRRRAACV